MISCVIPCFSKDVSATLNKAMLVTRIRRGHTSRASWIKEQMTVEDIIMAIKSKMQTQAGHILTLMADGLPRIQSGSPEVEGFEATDVEIKLEHLTEQDGVNSDKENWRPLEKSFVLQGTCNGWR